MARIDHARPFPRLFGTGTICGGSPGGVIPHQRRQRCTTNTEGRSSEKSAAKQRSGFLWTPAHNTHSSDRKTLAFSPHHSLHTSIPGPYRIGNRQTSPAPTGKPTWTTRRLVAKQAHLQADAAARLPDRPLVSLSKASHKHRQTIGHMMTYFRKPLRTATSALSSSLRTSSRASSCRIGNVSVAWVSAEINPR